MSWQWVNDLLAPSGRKRDFNWTARCPYSECPGNMKPPRVSREEWDNNLPKPKLRFVQVISPMVYQYRCGYCSCLVNISVEVPHENNDEIRNINPALFGGKADYKCSRF